MTDYLFEWHADLDGDGVAETLRYSTAEEVPDVEPPDLGRALRTEELELLNGNALVVTQLRSGKQDHRTPGRFTLSWRVAPAEFARLALEDYARARVVMVRLDHRWRQLRVTGSGLADRMVTVAAGYLLLADDTAWLAADAVHTCGAADVVVYVTPAGGSLTVGSGLAVPGGSTKVADITVAGDVVTVTSDPSGVACALTARVVGYRSMQGPVGLDGLELVLRELR